MSHDVLFEKTYPIKDWDFAHAGEASVNVKNILKDIGYPSDIIRRVAVASFEAEMNVVMYGQGGDMHFKVTPQGVSLIIKDQGPGIPDIDQAMVEGFSTATDEMREMGFGAGMGLPNIKRNCDEFQIDSQVGKGTRLELGFLIAA